MTTPACAYERLCISSATLTASSFRYIQMSDGAKLAADLFVPRGLSLDTAMPTILHQTRWEELLRDGCARDINSHRRPTHSLTCLP